MFVFSLHYCYFAKFLHRIGQACPTFICVRNVYNIDLSLKAQAALLFQW